jgi:hypothetical protein
MKTKIMIFQFFSLIILTGSMIWEGSAALAPDGELPASGFYAATNSYARNSIVEITNMENGKTVKAAVISGVQTLGLMVMLSREAAEMISLSSNTLCRVRMNQVSDRLNLPQNLSSGQKLSYVPENEWSNDSEIIDLPEYNFPAKAVEVKIQAPAVQPEMQINAIQYIIPQEHIIDSFEQKSLIMQKPPVNIQPAEQQYQQQLIVPELTKTIHKVPVITSLELGKHYIQLGAFRNIESAGNEINRIGSSYPLLILDSGVPDKPMYCILLGPLNQGESQAILERFKSTGYKDAFIRRK